MKSLHGFVKREAASTGALKDDMKVTPAGIKVLENLAAEPPRSATYHLRGQAAHGGAQWTMQALVKKGMMKMGEITPKGRAALKLAKDKTT